MREDRRTGEHACLPIIPHAHMHGRHVWWWLCVRGMASGCGGVGGVVSCEQPAHDVNVSHDMVAGSAGVGLHVPIFFLSFLSVLFAVLLYVIVM